MKESATVWARLCSAALLLFVTACSDDNTVEPAPSADAREEENLSGIEGRMRMTRKGAARTQALLPVKRRG